MLLLGENENFDGAVWHACGHDGAAVWEADAVELPVAVHDTNGTYGWQSFMEVYLSQKVFLKFLFQNWV